MKDQQVSPSAAPPSPPREVVRFGPFEFNRPNGLLYHGGAEVRLPPKALGVLRCLVEQPGSVVSKQDLLAAVWGDASVTEHSLSEAMRLLRNALEDDSQEPRFIQTVHRRGYRFIAPVSTDEDDSPLTGLDRESFVRRLSRTLTAGAGYLETRRRPISWGLAGLAAGIVAGGIGYWGLVPEIVTEAHPVTRFAIEMQPRLNDASIEGPSAVLSPDGTKLVYVGRAGIKELYLRRMSDGQAAVVGGSAGAMNPFFSPDGEWIGFFADGRLKKTSVAGGEPTIVCDTPRGRGASWGADGNIVFAPDPYSSLSQVSAGGGTPQILTELERDEISHRWPQILPGGKGVLYTACSPTSCDVAALLLETGEQRVLIEEAFGARYAPTGHLTFARTGVLLAVPFDLGRLEVIGSPLPVVEGLLTTVGGAGLALAEFTLSDTGTLAYLAVEPRVSERTISWVNREGQLQPLSLAKSRFWNAALSPDSRSLALSIGTEITEADIWRYDLGRGTLTRLTFDPGIDAWPLWSPDGKHVAFSSNRDGPFEIYWVPADGSRLPEQILTNDHPHFQYPESWTPDGKILAFTEFHPTSGFDLWVLPLGGEREPRPFLRTSFDESSPAFSPDGQWIAYESTESGRNEVYVRPFPGPGAKHKISSQGGLQPSWASDGQELFYRDGNKLMVATVNTEREFASESPQVLVELEGLLGYEAASDGQRLLIIQGGGEVAPQQLNVVLNWFEELKRWVPTER